MVVKNFYRFGITGEQRLFEEMSGNYYGIVISAHLVAFYEKFFSTFLSKIQKPFFIDTVSYVFARDLDNIKKIDSSGEKSIKKSYQKLIDYCGGNIKATLEEREFLPKDFSSNNEKLIKEFSKKLISFQKKFFEKDTSKAIQRYSEILGRSLDKIQPLFLTTPYFYFTSLDDPWYDISLKICNKSKTLKGNFPLYAVLCFAKDLLLHKELFVKIIDDYSDFDGYLIWISDFNEKIESKDYLLGYMKFIQALAKTGKTIYNLYGEYFSLVLSKFGLSGYSRGIGFSESKFVDARVTGGGMPKRYYLPFLHIPISETLAREFFSDYPELLCNCKICQVIRAQLNISSNPTLRDIMHFFNELNYSDAKKHFMEIHSREIAEITTKSIDETLELLQKEFVFSQNYHLDLYNINNQHLKKWFDCIIG